MEFLNLFMSPIYLTIIEAVPVACLFWAALAHPERVHNTGQFRVAGFLVGAAIISPSAIQSFVFTLGGMGGPAGGGRNVNELSYIAVFASLTPGVLVLLTIVLALDAVSPRHVDRMN